ncbi:peroxidase 51 [Canna indica]|uniref:Peroxidase n=1 Tax=Canna indica TaxID=4628 RepID=A0AAQ3KW99_9LILI|nr:peroxidase 51 [Canna indica]
MEMVKLLLVLVMALELMVGSVEGHLRPNFYQSNCPNVESIVKEAVRKKLNQTVVTIPATLRLFFHDCFVEGCDASVMIASPRDDAEKDAHDNISLAGDGFDTVIKAKQAVEVQCPGVVSCADILAIAARDVVVLSGGPSFTVELGRRDGVISQAGRVTDNLPGPDFDLDQLTSIFAKNNLTVRDMIALSGAHTVGFSHCDRFANRLYGPAGADPTLDPEYASALMKACPRDVDPTIAVNIDLYTPITFDNVFYKNLMRGMGLFSSDEVLFTDERSRPVVRRFAKDQSSFFKAFAAAMVRLGRLGAKTGEQGEIRRDCTAFNN